MPRRLLLAAVTIAALLVGAPAARADWIWPVQGEVITPYRNGADPYAGGQHRGIDIAADTGTPVVAAAGGEVRFAGTAGSSGLTVSIRTADGLFDTSYLHLSSTAVHKGDRVSAGARVGAVGMTGRRSAAAPHLHFGVRDAGTDHGYHDPLAFLPPPPIPAERPRAVPAPVPEPVPALPLPEPTAAPTPRPKAPSPEPHRAPRAGPHRAPIPRSAPVPEHIRRPLQTRQPGPTPATAPRGIPHAKPVPHGARRRSPAPNGAPQSEPAPASEPHAAPTVDDHPAPNPARAAEPATPGPDLGYALACVGLLLAAAVLGLSGEGRQATRRSRARVIRVLRPLLGRR
jgi:murein DD-endopeptidase MepM/ murein hydrolase activator NlpD